MLLRAAIVMLVMLNLGAALWWISGAHVASTPVAEAPSDVPGLRLLHEAAPEPVHTPSVSPPSEPEPAGVEADPLAVGPQVVDEAAAPAASPVCLRFGPFADAAASDAARAALASAGVPAIPRQTPGRASRGWKVATAPFASREAAVDMVERLRAAGVTDLYVMAEGPEANSIALGRYGSEEAARRRQADLRSRGFEVNAEPLGGGVMQAWLDARVEPQIERAALERIAPSRAIDCTGLR